jgi:hypothetical protein
MTNSYFKPGQKKKVINNRERKPDPFKNKSSD